MREDDNTHLVVGAAMALLTCLIAGLILGSMAGESRGYKAGIQEVTEEAGQRAQICSMVSSMGYSVWAEQAGERQLDCEALYELSQYKGTRE